MYVDQKLLNTLITIFAVFSLRYVHQVASKSWFSLSPFSVYTVLHPHYTDGVAQQIYCTGMFIPLCLLPIGQMGKPLRRVLTLICSVFPIFVDGNSKIDFWYSRMINQGANGCLKTPVDQ